MIKNETIANSNTDILIATAQLAVIGIVLSNFSTAGNETVTVYLIPSSESAGDNTTLMKQKVVGVGSEVIFETKLILENGDKIVAVGANGNRVTAHITYMGL